MWTKKSHYSLYVSMLLQMAFSTLISIIVFLCLVGIEHYFYLDGTITLFESIKSIITSEVHHIYAGTFSIIIFFIMSFRIISKLVAYIKVIEAGIRKIPEDNTTDSIPIKGTNELARLAQSVNEIKDELKQKKQKEKANELHRRTLITNISHDLRTPLTSIIGYLDLAKNRIPSNDEAYQYLEIAENNSLRLKKLISDLFLYSKVISEDIKIDLQEVNIRILLNQIVELKTYPINFLNKLHEQTLLVSAEYVHRIFDNLLDNAKKYSPEGKEITLMAQQDEGGIIIEIKNFTEEDLSPEMDFLTKRLYTADRNRNEFSSGLGLSIVSELMNKMQGELNLHFDKTDKTFSARLFFYNSQKIA